MASLKDLAENIKKLFNNTASNFNQPRTQSWQNKQPVFKTPLAQARPIQWGQVGQQVQQQAPNVIKQSRPLVNNFLNLSAGGINSKLPTYGQIGNTLINNAKASYQRTADITKALGKTTNPQIAQWSKGKIGLMTPEDEKAIKDDMIFMVGNIGGLGKLARIKSPEYQKAYKGFVHDIKNSSFVNNIGRDLKEAEVQVLIDKLSKFNPNQFRSMWDQQAIKLARFMSLHKSGVVANLPRVGLGTKEVGKKPTKVLTNNESRAIQEVFNQKLEHIKQLSSSADDYSNKLTKLVQDTIKSNNRDRTVLSGLRTSLNKELIGSVGEQGGYKQNYAMLQTLKKDPNWAHLETIEANIAQLDDFLLNASKKPIAQPPTPKAGLYDTGKLQSKKLEFDALVKKMESEKARLNKIDPNRQISVMGDNLLSSKDYNRMQELGGEISRTEDALRGISSQADIKEIVQLKRQLRQKGISFNEKASKQELQSLAGKVNLVSEVKPSGLKSVDAGANPVINQSRVAQPTTGGATGQNLVVKSSSPVLKSEGYGAVKMPEKATEKIRIVSKQTSPVGKTSSPSPIIPQTGVNKTGFISKMRERVQDNWIRIKNLERQKGVKVDESTSPYLKEELYHGRVATRLENVKDTIKQIDQDILNTSKTTKIADKELKTQINKYLQAKHAPERNAIHGDGAAGMTNKEAQATIKELSKNKEIVRLSGKVKELNNKTLDILYEGQVIDKKTYDLLKTTYKEHVPLNRVMSETDDMTQILVNKGFNVKGTGIKRAKGSEREVADILTNTVANVEAAIVRAEKNRVNLATLKFARNNPQLGIFEEIRPQAIGETFGGKAILQKVEDPLVLTIRENGKPVYLKIKDEKLASAFQGIGNERLPSLFKFVETFTRFYSGLHTRFNPEFAFSNKVRDLQEMAVYMASQKGVGFTGAFKAVGRDTGSAKAILDAIRGKTTEDARLYNQMRMDGGTTGGMALSTRKQVEINLKQIEQINRSNPRKAVEKLLEGFDKWNTIFEDSTRLSVYKEALSRGFSREHAASLAKNSTVNFNKKGTGGPIINALYMFSNASIQGSVKMLRALKDPKVLATVSTLMGASAYTVNSWNDAIDPKWRDKVTAWDKMSNVVVMLPSDEGVKYITLPVSWGTKPLWAMANASYDLATGNMDIKEGASLIANAAFDAYNPAGGTSLVSAATPTIFDTPFELFFNQSWTGSSIKPDWMKGLPQAEQKWKDTDKTLSGKVASVLTSSLSKNTNRLIDISPNDLLYAYQAYIGGTGKFLSRAINTGTSLISGEVAPAKDTPFINRFYKTRSDEQVQSSIAKQSQVGFMSSLKKYDTGSVEQKEAIKTYLRQLGSDNERQSVLFKLRDQGFDTKGISYSAKKLGGMTNTPITAENITFEKNPEDPKNIFEKVSLAARGVLVDPENTIKAIFTQEELRKIEGNAVILKRQEFLNKSKDKSLARDHIIPLGLGGDNSDENLQYVDKEWHAKKTALDTKLIKQLQNGQITKEEARKQVKEWVANNPTKVYVLEEGAEKIGSFTDSENVYTYTDKESGNEITVDLSEPIEAPKYTGNKEVDKKLKSRYTSAINKRINDIVDLYENGQLTADEAEKLIGEIRTQASKAGGSGKGKKPKKITIKSLTPSKAITFSKSSAKLPSAIKLKSPPVLKTNKARKINIKVADTKVPALKIKPFKNSLTEGFIKLK